MNYIIEQLIQFQVWKGNDITFVPSGINAVSQSNKVFKPRKSVETYKVRLLRKVALTLKALNVTLIFNTAQKWHLCHQYFIFPWDTIKLQFLYSHIKSTTLIRKEPEDIRTEWWNVLIKTASKVSRNRADLIV